MGIEITTQVGCPVNCLKYCPQEVFLKRYSERYGKQAPKMLSFAGFQKIIRTVPESCHVHFSGFTEPFSNSDCINMVEYAHQRGHPIELFTTFVGCTKEIVDRLSKIKLETITIHLPDGKAMPMPASNEFQGVFFYALEKLQSNQWNYISMHDGFVTNNRENVSRGKYNKTTQYGYCIKFHNAFAPITLPNGEVYLCCQDFGLMHRLGNLYVDTFKTLKSYALLHEGKFNLCNMCQFNGNNNAVPTTLYQRTCRKIVMLSNAGKIRLLKKGT